MHSTIMTMSSCIVCVMQCAQEMQHIIRLARRDGDEWVRLFAGILAPFPHTQSIAMDVCLEGSMEGVVEEIGEARMCAYVCVPVSVGMSCQLVSWSPSLLLMWT